MRTIRTRRLVALITGAALLASLTVATVAAPASAAKPKCAGKVATIVGTARSEVIRGTAKDDVIVAKGGHDIVRSGAGNDTVCGNSGNDKLVGGGGNDLLLGQTGRDKHFGGPGRDRLLGGPHNDSFNGGTGNDACLQGSGTGPLVNCERPAPLPVAPPPPPPGPSLIPMTGILAVAYSDIDGLDGYSTGDVLIARLIDTAPGGLVDAGDTIEMGRYPTNFDASAFGDWGDKSHVVSSVAAVTPLYVQVRSIGDLTNFTWAKSSTGEWYQEVIGASQADFGDGLTVNDYIRVMTGSPSVPQTPVPLTQLTRLGDDALIDIVLNY